MQTRACLCAWVTAGFVIHTVDCAVRQYRRRYRYYWERARIRGWRRHKEMAKKEFVECYSKNMVRDASSVGIPPARSIVLTPCSFLNGPTLQRSSNL